MYNLMESNQKNENLKSLNFYPGPSKLYPNVDKYALDAFDSGILEQNHRSLPFMAMLEKTIELFKKKLDVPTNYKVFLLLLLPNVGKFVLNQFFLGKFNFCIMVHLVKNGLNMQ